MIETEAKQEDDTLHANLRESIYFWLLFCLGTLALICSCLFFQNFWQINSFDIFMFLVLNIVAEQTYVVLPHGSKLSASFAILLAALILFNTPVTVLLAAASSLITIGLIQKRGWRIAFFNASQYAITYTMAGFAMFLTHQQVSPYMDQNPLFESLISAGAASAVYLLLNLPLVNGYLAVRQNPHIGWKEFRQKLIKIKDDRLEVFQTSFFYPIAVLVAHSYQREHNPIIPVLLAFLVFGGLRFIDQRRRIERYGEKMQVLYHLTKKMGESVLLDADIEVDAGHVFDHLFTSEASSIKRLITNQRTSVYRVHKGENGRIVHAKSDSLLEPEKVYHLEEKGILQDIVKTKQGVNLSVLTDLGKSYSTWRITYQSLMACPILVDDEVTFILVMFRTAGESFQERDEGLLKLLINAFEITLKNLQLRNKIQEQAIKDGLMGVFNHRYLKLKLEEEMMRAKRYNKPLPMIIADVDYFKKFNDTHGHLLGDKVLKEIAGILQESVRETDIVARYGGEELAILLPETPFESACEVAERIRRNVAAFPFTGKEQQTVSMSLSIGISCLDNEPDLEPSELIIRTDTALYRAKHQGRNQICKAQLERGRLVIETYSRGVSPQPAQELSQAESLRPNLRKTWLEQIEKSIPELERKLRFEVEAAHLSSSLERFFAQKFLPAIPQLLQAMSQVEVDHQGQIIEQAPLSELLSQLAQSANRRIQRLEDLRLLQNLLLKIYRHFARQCLGLNANDIERRTLFNQGWRIVMQIQDQLFVSSLNRIQSQTDYARSQHRFAHQLLQVLHQYQAPESALTEVLRQIQAIVPQMQFIFLAQPEAVGQAFDVDIWLPQDVPLSLSLLLQERTETAPKMEPSLIEFGMKDLGTYLNLNGELPDLPDDNQVVLIPLYLQEKLYGLVGMLLPTDQKLSQSQRYWLKSACMELAESLELLRDMQAQDRQSLSTLRTLVDVVQGSLGSFHAERIASLAVRMAQRVGLHQDEHQDLKDAAYLQQLGILMTPSSTTISHQRQAQMLNQRLSNALALKELEKPLRHVLERWDGSGFPDGLSGQRIPLPARILSLVYAYVNCVDQHTSPLMALEELEQTGYYDPKLCTLLKDMIRESN